MPHERTLVLGIDVAWWGGSAGNRASQCDTVIAGLLGPDATPDLRIHPVWLYPQPGSGQVHEPNFDPHGDLLLGQVDEILRDMPHDRCVLALDAPLNPPGSTGHEQRLRTSSAGSTRRACERHLHAGIVAARRLQGPGWPGPQIQAGSPGWPRVQRITDGLARRGFTLHAGTTRTPRDLIEVFPSEAIWALGVLGHYDPQQRSLARAYKAKPDRRVPTRDRSITHEVAWQRAQAPMRGFLPLLADAVPHATDWLQGVAKEACERSTDASDRAKVLPGKGFDDPIDSGIAFLTGVCFALDRSHCWGQGEGGAIIGPGIWPPHLAPPG